MVTWCLCSLVLWFHKQSIKSVAEVIPPLYKINSNRDNYYYYHYYHYYHYYYYCCHCHCLIIIIIIILNIIILILIITWSETYFCQDLFPAYLFFRRQFHAIVIFRLKSISDLDSGSLPRWWIHTRKIKNRGVVTTTEREMARNTLASG